MRAGGYLLTRRVPRPAYVAEFMPPSLLSASSCICPTIPHVWSLRWTHVDAADRENQAAAWRVSLEEAIDWVTANFDPGGVRWPNLFGGPSIAREFAGRFLAGSPDVVLLGLGLHETLVARFIEDSQPWKDEADPGIRSIVRQRAPLDGSGRSLGHEVLGYDHGAFHSWLCNGLEKPVSEQLDINPGPAGFITDLDEALAAAEYCGRDETGAEPGIWMPWILVEYDWQ